MRKGKKNGDVNSNFYSEANFRQRGICMRGWRCQYDKTRHVTLEI